MVKIKAWSFFPPFQFKLKKLIYNHLLQCFWSAEERVKCCELQKITSRNQVSNVLRQKKKKKKANKVSSCDSREIKTYQESDLERNTNLAIFCPPDWFPRRFFFFKYKVTSQILTLILQSYNAEILLRQCLSYVRNMWTHCAHFVFCRNQPARLSCRINNSSQLTHICPSVVCLPLSSWPWFKCITILSSVLMSHCVVERHLKQVTG